MFVNVNGRMIAAVPKILPAVYEDALSYYEQLKIINEKLNEVIETINNYGEGMLETATQYTDTQIAHLKQETATQIAQIQADVNAQFAQMSAEIQSQLDTALADFKSQSEQLLADFTAQVQNFNTQMSQLQIQINALFDILNHTKLEWRQEMQAQIDGVMDYLDNALAAKLGSSIIVINPYSQTLTTLDRALADLFRITYSMFSLTASQYKSLELTVEEYKELAITANDYLYKGYWIFFRELNFPNLDSDFEKVYQYINDLVEAQDKQFYMVSPFDGQVTLTQKVVYQLAQLHMRGITADQYKEALLSVDEYKDKELTAHDYAWNGYYLIYTDATPVPTLEEQIAEAQNQIAALTSRVQVLENGATPSATIAQMQTDIVANRKALTSYQTVQATRDTDQDTEINKINTVTIPTLETKTATSFANLRAALDQTRNDMMDDITENETKITTVTNGLKAIHITYPLTTTFNNRR